MSKEELLIGLTMVEAEEIIRNCVYRIIEDDKKYNLSKDYNPGRFNLFLKNGKITEVILG